ncbi:diguanylate cyclase [Nocardioides sp. zg-ZUI104]|uniref:GGDEF domain-containing protein n=1 Tax=Nocardioides faecalis TaxID=2803858 RepID=UPI001BCF0E26|nr:diguanylate cyclase [Nocardioides faecalis]MBS4754493.1 diguanylate cyclase [Nocardioides faecalis]
MTTGHRLVRNHGRRDDDAPMLPFATATMYLSSAAMLGVGIATWSPGKNPRWLIVVLALVALGLAIAVVALRKRFTRRHALVLVTVQVGAICWLTDHTHVDLAAVMNGAVLPIIGAFCAWFLHPRWGRAVVYGGSAVWLALIAERGEALLVGFALSIALQTVLTAEAFAVVHRRVDRLTRIDPLTLLPNRRDIIAHAEREFERAQRRGEPFTLVMIDIDGLRDVNNNRGHSAGDDMIRDLAAHWRSRLDRQQRIGRIGGDEFVLVLPGVPEDGARALVARLVQDSPSPWSAGVASARPGEPIDQLADRADQDMYAAKHARSGAQPYPHGARRPDEAARAPGATTAPATDGAGAAGPGDTPAVVALRRGLRARQAW